MSKSFLVDTTLCTACRGCQVACKQWHDLPAEKTVNRGSYQNPADLSFDTYKLVRMREEVIDGRLRWLFFCGSMPALPGTTLSRHRRRTYGHFYKRFHRGGNLHGQYP